jgi:hypothetical protein
MTTHKDVSFRLALALSLAMLPLTGMAADIQPGAPGAGVVVASFPAREVAVNGLTVKGGPRNKSFDLQLIPGRADMLAGAWLPEGDYTLVTLDGRDVEGSPSFHVKAGAATDLGALVEVDLGNYHGAVAHIHNQRADADAALALAALSAPQPIDIVSWAPGDAPLKLAVEAANNPLGGLVVGIMADINHHKNAKPLSERLGKSETSESLLTAAKDSALPYMMRGVRDANGKLYYGGDLGQVRVRDPQGTWGTLDTGSLHRVTALAIAGDLLVAGMDNGTLRASHDEGKHWDEVAHLDCGGGRVTDLEFSGDRWAATAMTGREMFGEAYPRLFIHSSICVYVSDDADITHLTERKKAVSDGLRYYGMNGHLAKNAYFTLIAPDLMRLDLATMTWSKVAIPDSVTNFDMNEASHTAVAAHAQGMFSSVFLSTDDGATWKKIDRPPYVIKDIAFLSPTEGYAVRMQPHTFTVQTLTYSYNAAANQWMKTKELPLDCAAAMSDADGKPAFCLTRGGSILNLASTPMALEYLRD